MKLRTRARRARKKIVKKLQATTPLEVLSIIWFLNAFIGLLGPNDWLRFWASMVIANMVLTGELIRKDVAMRQSTIILHNTNVEVSTPVMREDA